MATGTIERPYAGNSALMALGSADALVPENANFNDYIVPGVYSILNGAVATTLSNRPSNYAGLLRVYKTLGQGNDAGSSWYYVTQQYEDLNGDIYRRRGSSGSTSAISWWGWSRVVIGLQYVEETIYVSFSAGAIGTRGFQKKLSASAPSGKKIIGTALTYIGDSSQIIPIMSTTGTDLYLNAYRATDSAVTNNEVRVRFAFVNA